MYQIKLGKIVMVMYCQYNFLEVMYWYWYYIFGDMMSNVMQYFLKVMFKALPVAYSMRYFLSVLIKSHCKA